ncbi:VIT1/CCC1 transporter family protein [Jiangella asiatica]|uniref:VIT family protein n=1 Tax=Jiangella asiatica TaxID=2530372 RepID=A0A4R5CN19_9ACTN|nr:VIT family protein [Jiangella asiatica]TDE01792.1 VIT family protein [Jiangella asiatica]
MSDAPETDTPHAGEQHDQRLANKLNWLRAGILGANDGIISTAGLVVGVAGATTDRNWLLVTGLAGMVAGAFSMAGGEYTSVSAQRDTEQAALAKERWELEHLPSQELAELTHFYVEKGLSPDLAAQVADQLTREDALAAHAEVELGIDADEQTNPWQAAVSSFVSFALGAALPLLAIVLPPPTARVPVTMVTVVVALALTGYVGARLGGAHRTRAAARAVVVGLLTMAVTYGVGSALGVSVF